MSGKCKIFLGSAPIALLLAMAGCIRGSPPPEAPVGDDRTITFPQFFDGPAITLGTDQQIYELDGAVLRAVMVAANDFLPPGASKPSCPNLQEAQNYRIIRQGSIIFVYIYEKEAYCGAPGLALDSGAKYAISAQGRILRRVLDGQPEEPRAVDLGDAGSRGVRSRPGVTPAYDSIWNQPTPPGVLPAERDGGLGADGGDAAVLDDGGRPRSLREG